MARQKQNDPILFDTLSYAKKLQAAGFTQEQAEVQAETFLGIVQEQLVSKRDLKEVEKNLRVEIEKVRKDLKVDIEMSSGSRLRAQAKHHMATHFYGEEATVSKLMSPKLSLSYVVTQESGGVDKLVYPAVAL